MCPHKNLSSLYQADALIWLSCSPSSPLRSSGRPTGSRPTGNCTSVNSFEAAGSLCTGREISSLAGTYPGGGIPLYPACRPQLT